jgi:probable HAF family extracellular repeat protein
VKSGIWTCITATTVFAALALPDRLPAQGAEQNKTLPRYSVTSLGTLGGTYSTAAGINNKGLVSGDANLAGDVTEHATLWRNGVITDLGTLGGANSAGNPVNERGMIAGDTQTSILDPLGENWGLIFTCTPAGGLCQGYQNLTRAFLWQNGVMTPLPTLGGNNSFLVSNGALNNLGQVVGFAENSTQDPNCIAPQVFDWEAVVWGPKAGEVKELPPLPGDSVGAALGINGIGQVVGATSGTCGFPSFALPLHAVLWQNGSVTDLGSFGGVMSNAGVAINTEGQVVGISDSPGDTTTHAFLWQNGLMTDLGTLPGDYFSFANDINDKGQVVGQSCDVNFNCRVFLWQNGVMTDLNALIPPDSPLYLTYGGGINDRGEIAGQAFNQNTGDAPAFLAIPVAGSSAVQLGGNSTPRVTLPEKVRKGLQRRMRLGLFGTPLMGPQ